MLSPRDAAMIHILHLCSYYAGSSVYRNLINELSEDSRVGVQSVYIPIRKNSDLDNNRLNKSDVNYRYSKCLNLFTRIIYSLKQTSIALSFLLSRNSRNFISQSNVIHAHTLYADGPLALLLNKLFGKPYVVTVRGTDVNYGFRFFRLWKPLARSILRHSNRIYFVSPRHLDIAKKYFPDLLSDARVLPNGLDNFWINKRTLFKKHVSSDGFRAVYVGSINRNKNLKNCIDSLEDTYGSKSYCFDVVGGSCHEYERTFGSLPDQVRSKINFLGHITDQSKIREILANSDIFLMPSHSETFGLAYLEAVSQCTPVVFSKGQGIDGYFEEGYLGYACHPNEVESISNAIKKTIQKWPNGLNFEGDDDNPVVQFSWESVAQALITSGYSNTEKT